MSSLWKGRWAAVGAAVAVTLGAGGLVSVSADSAQSVFVAITPTRVLDTRIDVGLTGPFVSGAARELDVTGAIAVALANDTAGAAAPVPDGATAIVANVTAVKPSAAGHVTVRPGGALGDLTTSTVNINSPGGAWPNAVTVEVGGNGKISVFYYGEAPGATTEMLVDVFGYYVEGRGIPGPQGDRGEPGPRGAVGPQGSRGPSAWDTIPSGVTVRGNIDWDSHGATDPATDGFAVALPGVAPAPLTDATVNFATAGTGDADATCTGSATAPTAPAGKVCVYLFGLYGMVASSLSASAGLPLADSGFRVVWTSTGLPNSDQFLIASWAYTAP